MKDYKIKLNEISKVQEFNRIACRQEFDIDLSSGRYIVDAKSIMGLFSLDLSSPIKLAIHADDEQAEKFLEEIKCYLSE